MPSPIGTAIFLPPSAAQGLANYPHARATPNNATSTTLYVSGTSSRRGDGTYAGYSVGSDGAAVLDVAEQTTAVLTNIKRVIETATNGKCGLESIIEATIFLTDMKDYKRMNDVWNTFFPERIAAPARTCVQVAALPNEKLCVEIKSIAIVPVDIGSS
ncbi:hypothetical protein RBB50_006289 [Rhinocladiella similis]